MSRNWCSLGGDYEVVIFGLWKLFGDRVLMKLVGGVSLAPGFRSLAIQLT